MTSPFKPPSFPEVVAIIRRLAESRTLTIHARCQPDVDDLEYDIEDISALLACIDQSELMEVALDDKGRPDLISILRIHPAGEPKALYVKLALRIPELTPGRILSFKVSKPV